MLARSGTGRSEQEHATVDRAEHAHAPPGMALRLDVRPAGTAP